jgi:hypothetical protein
MLRLIFGVQIKNGFAGRQAVIGYNGFKVADMVCFERIEVQFDALLDLNGKY